MRRPHQAVEASPPPTDTELSTGSTSGSTGSPTRRRLLALMASLPAIDRHAAAETSERRPCGHPGQDPTSRLFTDFQACLAEHERAFQRCHRLEASLAVEVGYLRVRLPTPPGAPARYAAEAISVVEHVPPGPQRDRLLRTLHRHRTRWNAAAEAVGLAQAQDQEELRFQAVRAAADTLYAIPATSRVGILLKLIVLLSLEAPGEAFRDASPWRELRLILADLNLLADEPGARR